MLLTHIESCRTLKKLFGNLIRLKISLFLLTLSILYVLIKLDHQKGEKMFKKEIFKPAISEEDRIISDLISWLNSARKNYECNLSGMRSDLEIIKMELRFNLNYTDVISNDEAYLAMLKIAPLVKRIRLIGNDLEKELSKGEEDVVIDEKSIDYLEGRIKTNNDYYASSFKKLSLLFSEVEKEALEIEKIISSALRSYDSRFGELEALRSSLASEFK